MDNHQIDNCPNCGEIVVKGFNFCPVCQFQLQSDEAGKKGNGGNLKGELDKALEKLAEKEKIVEKLTADKNNAEYQNAINQAREEGKAESNEKIQDLENQLNELNEKLKAKENQQREEETTTLIAELNSKVESSEATIEEKTNEINSLIIEVANREDKIKRLEKQILGSNVSIDDKEKQIKELNSKFVEKEAKYKVYIKIMLIAISVVSMLAIVSFVIMISSAPEDKPGGLMTVSFSNVIDNLEGSYTMLKTHNGHIVSDNVSIIITGNGMGKYKIEQHDQANSPDSCYFSIGQNAVLNSPDIGIGDIKYTKNGKHNKINLEFKKDNTVWKFTKR